MGFSGGVKRACLSGLAVLLLAASTVAAADRFTKMDGQGQALPDDAKEWAMVFDAEYGLYWEVKSADGSIHAKERAYTFAAAKEIFVAEVNAEKLGGYNDWRLPATSELGLLKIKKEKSAEALIDLQYFPETMPARYMSLGWCGSKSEYQEESVKFGKLKVKGGKYVMAVRGKPLE